MGDKDGKRHSQETFIVLFLTIPLYRCLRHVQYAYQLRPTWLHSDVAGASGEWEEQ